MADRVGRCLAPVSSATGSAPGVNQDLGNGLAGIADFQTSETEIEANVISGNGNTGVWLMGTISATLTANLIGVGTPAIQPFPTIGTVSRSQITPTITNWAARRMPMTGIPSAATCGCGVAIVSGSSWNTLDGNYIGLGGATGNVIIPNATAGVCFFDANLGNTLSSTEHDGPAVHLREQPGGRLCLQFRRRFHLPLHIDRR